VFATGARAQCLPIAESEDVPHLHSFRTLSDAERLRQDMRSGGSMLVVGGGYTGLETAAVARSVGMRVTLIKRDNRILGRVAPAEIAAYFKELHLNNGVRICEGVELKILLVRRETDGVTAWLSNGGTIDADVGVAGIGVVPETGLAAQANLHVDDGIVVESAGRTSDPFIYAAGGCARFPYQGAQIRLESVQNAVDMAETMVRSIAGETAAYRSIPWFWSDQYSSRLQIAGFNQGHTHVVCPQGVGNSIVHLVLQLSPRYRGGRDQ